MTATSTSRAPGKALLLGEYAVLYGGTALVAAVDCFARVHPLEQDQREDARVAFTRRALAEKLGWKAGQPLLVDSSTFFLRGAKLGLGSSSAMVAAVAVDLARQNHQDPCRDEVRRLLWPVAMEVHNRMQGFSGSGADVAACLFGGLLLVRPRETWLRPLSLPAGLELVFCWTGHSSSTGDMLRAVDCWGRHNPTALDRLVERMRGIMEELARAEPKAARFVELMAAYEGALQSLGDSSGAPIVTPLMRDLAEAARALGGAAKPSGAGGGDMLVAAFTGPEAAGDFRGECAARGAMPIDVAIDFQGARVATCDEGAGAGP